MSTSGEAFQPVKSADRTLDVIETLADSEQHRTLAELSAQLSIPKSSLHGILRTMARRGWVELDSTGTRFGLGLRALRTGTAYVDRDDAVARVQPILDWLSSELGETAHLGRLDGADVVYLAKRESPHPIRLYSAIGRRLPAHATALGKSVLATRDDSAVDRLLPRELGALTSQTITDHTALLAELARCRHDGYAVDRSENSDDVQCYAVALAPRNGAPTTDAVSVSIPLFRLSDDLAGQTIRCLLEVNERLRKVS